MPCVVERESTLVDAGEHVAFNADELRVAQLVLIAWVRIGAL